MMNVCAEIRKRYGNVKRTRGFYLYTEKNVRLIDCYLDGGMSVLGRKKGQAGLAAKQFFDRGMAAFLPSKTDYQLEKAVKSVLPPKYTIIRFYASQEKADTAVCTALGLSEAVQLPRWRPLLYRQDGTSPDTGVSARAACCWSDPLILHSEVCAVVPAYPVPYGIVAATEAAGSSLPPSDMLLPPLSASLARAFYDIKRKMEQPRSVSASRKTANKTQRQRDRLEKLLSALWCVQGCYLYPCISETAYGHLFLAALDAHIVLSPDYYTPSIIPELDVYTELLHFFDRYPAER